MTTFEATKDSPSRPAAYILGVNGETVRLPIESPLHLATYEQRNTDLIVTDIHGTRAYIRSYFIYDHLPDLVSVDGQTFRGELVSAYLNLSGRMLDALSCLGAERS